MQFNDLTRLIGADATSTCVPGPSRFPIYDRVIPEVWRQLSLDWSEFSIFNKTRQEKYSSNGWSVDLSSPLRLSGQAVAIDPPELETFFANAYILAQSTRDGSDVIAVNCNDSSQYGEVFFANSSYGIGLGLPVVARSIEEWLERTFLAGFGSDAYFHLPDFEDLGPTIPNDPEYNGIRGYFRRI